MLTQHGFWNGSPYAYATSCSMSSICVVSRNGKGYSRTLCSSCVIASSSNRNQKLLELHIKNGYTIIPLQAQVPIWGWLMAIPWCVTLSGCQDWLLRCSTLFQNSDDTTRWISLPQHLVKPLHTSRYISCKMNSSATRGFPTELTRRGKPCCIVRNFEECNYFLYGDIRLFR